MYRPILVSIGSVAALVASSMFAHGQGPARPAVSAPVAVTADVGTQRMTDALAVAVVENIGRQFATGDVTVQLGPVQVVEASERDRQLQGSGRLRIDGDSQWIAFRFAALYDTETTEVGTPRLQLARGPATAKADAALARKLQARVSSALAEEFAGQPVSWAPGATHATAATGRLLRLSGTGVADFGAEGRVDARVDALYDRVTGRWLHVRYELGEPAAGATQDAVAQA